MFNRARQDDTGPATVKFERHALFRAAKKVHLANLRKHVNIRGFVATVQYFLFTCGPVIHVADGCTTDIHRGCNSLE